MNLVLYDYAIYYSRIQLSLLFICHVEVLVCHLEVEEAKLSILYVLTYKSHK